MKNLKTSTVLGIIGVSTLLLASGGAMADSGYFSIGFSNSGSDYMPYRHADRGDGRGYHDHWQRSHEYRGGHIIDRIQAEQRERIHRAARYGELTPREVARLEKEQREIERMQRRYLSDGHLSPFERNRLLAELDQASRHIWRESHDKQDRDHYRPRFHD